MRNLIVELLKYVKTTGKPINLVPADLPAELKIGWMDKNSGEHWAIGINRAKKWVDSLDEEKKEVAKEALTSSKGKINMASALSKSINKHGYK